MNKSTLFFSSVICCAAILTGCGNTPVKEEQTARDEIYSDYLNRDVRDDIFYFVMPDRFNNANPDNDNGSLTYEISQGGIDLTSTRGFHGGDMQGLEEKLDYLKGMGITAIWMTPILRNKAVQKDGVAHHGYWIVDFTQIDPHFGSNDDLKSLIKAAHKKGIKIFFDIITNHTADVIKYRECHDDNGVFKEGFTHCEYKSLAQVAAGDTYTPFVPEKEKTAKFPAWLNDPKYYHNQGDTTFQGENSLYGDFNGLDDLNTEHPEVLSGMIDIYKNIISDFKPDGFRIDTVRHVKLPFWQEFGPAIMEHAKNEGIPNFHIFGEVYDPNPAHLSEFTTVGKLPAVLDFGFQQSAADVFYRDQNPQTIATLFDNDDYYNDADSQADLLLTFLGNHDMGRTGLFLNKGMSDASEDEKLQRSILSHALMYMARGIPVVYYGDEQGFTGDGNDVMAREDMFPSQVASYNDNDLLGTDKTTADSNFDTDHPIYEAIAEFSQVRMEHKALRRGIHVNRYFESSSKAFAFSRIDPQEQVEYLVVFNGDTTPQTVAVAAGSDGYQSVYGDAAVSKSNETVSVKLAPLSFVVLKATAPLRTTTDLGIKVSSVKPAVDAESRTHLTYDVQAEKDSAFAFVKVTTEIKNAQGDFELLATDYTAPYSVIASKDLLVKGATLRVTVDNLQGASKQHIVKIP